MIFCMFNIPEISIRCPEDICWVKRHVKWSSRIMPHSGIFPPLAEEYVHAVLLKFVINTTISSLKWNRSSLIKFIENKLTFGCYFKIIFYLTFFFHFQSNDLLILSTFRCLVPLYISFGPILLWHDIFFSSWCALLQPVNKRSAT